MPFGNGRSGGGGAGAGWPPAAPWFGPQDSAAQAYALLERLTSGMGASTTRFPFQQPVQQDAGFYGPQNQPPSYESLPAEGPRYGAFHGGDGNGGMPMSYGPAQQGPQAAAPFTATSNVPAPRSRTGSSASAPTGQPTGLPPGLLELLSGAGGGSPDPRMDPQGMAGFTSKLMQDQFRGTQSPMVPERPLRMGPTGGPFGMSGETLDNVARAVLQASQQFQPRNDFEGFLGGLAGGLAGGRVQDMHQRESFNQREQDRADMRTQANVKSEDERRQFVRSAASSLASHRQQLIRDRMQAEARAQQSADEFAREAPLKREQMASTERASRGSRGGGGGGPDRFDDMTKLDVQSVREFYQPQVSAAHDEVKRLKGLRAKAGSLGGKREVLAATGAKDVPSAISALDAEISKAQAEAVRVGQEMKQAVREAATGMAAEPPYVPAGVPPPAAPVQGQPAAAGAAGPAPAAKNQAQYVRDKIQVARRAGMTRDQFTTELEKNSAALQAAGIDLKKAYRQVDAEWDRPAPAGPPRKARVDPLKPVSTTQSSTLTRR